MTPELPQRSEQDEQMALFEWADRYALVEPRLKLLHASLAGNIKVTFRQLNKLKKMGAKKGVPDIFLPVAANGYNGLWIELKRRRDGRISGNQKCWLQELANQGYYAVVCMGSDAAKKCIVDYLDLKI